MRELLNLFARRPWTARWRPIGLYGWWAWIRIAHRDRRIAS